MVLLFLVCKCPCSTPLLKVSRNCHWVCHCVAFNFLYQKTATPCRYPLLAFGFLGIFISSAFGRKGDDDMWNKSSQTSGLECWHSWSSSNLWGLGSETDPFCMGRQQALDGNKKRNSQKIIGGRGLLRSRVATRIHIVNLMRALQSIGFFREWPSWEREEINATHTCIFQHTPLLQIRTMHWSTPVE